MVCNGEIAVRKHTPSKSSLPFSLCLYLLKRLFVKSKLRVTAQKSNGLDEGVYGLPLNEQGQELKGDTDVTENVKN